MNLASYEIVKGHFLPPLSLIFYAFGLSFFRSKRFRVSNCWKCWKVKHQVQHQLQHQVLRALPDTVQYWKSLGHEGRHWAEFWLDDNEWVPSWISLGKWLDMEIKYSLWNGSIVHLGRHTSPWECLIQIVMIGCTQHSGRFTSENSRYHPIAFQFVVLAIVAQIVFPFLVRIAWERSSW